MKRREFIGLLGSAAVAWPRGAIAQQARKMWRIAYLAETHRPVDDIFRQSLRMLGYIEGSNLTTVYRWNSGGTFELLADDLVAQNPDLIVAVGSPATRAVKERTTRIPIVFVDVGDPVAYGFIPSLAHPGGNITGMSMLSQIGTHKTGRYGHVAWIFLIPKHHQPGRRWENFPHILYPLEDREDQPSP
jgi:putative tryptophan/tyrosine transport system substrate-binding protein